MGSRVILNFVDMDGVLAMTSLGLQRHLGLPEKPPIDYNWCDDLVDWSKLGIEFWENLPAYPEQLIAMKKLRNVKIVTHCFGLDAVIGKRRWLNKYWPEVEMINLADKWLLSRPNRCLWDDYPLQIQKWRIFGGTGMLVERSWNIYE